MTELGDVAAFQEPATAPGTRGTFYGTTYHKVADKTNQVALPKTFQRVLEAAREGHLVVIQYAEEAFLRVYTKKTFDQKMEEIKANVKLSEEEQNETVFWMAGESQVIEMDSQGRFVLPKQFAESLDRANREVAFQGAYSFIRVWPAELHRSAKRDAGKAGGAKELVKGILDR